MGLSMGYQDLVHTLNGYPKWARLDAQMRPSVYETISELVRAFQQASVSDRTAIASTLSQSSRYLMAGYTRQKAAEGLRSASKDAILQGLIPVVMAGGRSDTRTGGSLLALLLHSAERTGVDAVALFAFAAKLATDEDAAEQIRDFPSLPRSTRGIERFGYHERSTPEGATYEHSAEAMLRPRWYDRFLGRRRRSPDEVEMELLKNTEGGTPAKK